MPSEESTPAPIDHDLEFKLEQHLLQPMLIASLAGAASKLSTEAEELVRSVRFTTTQRRLIAGGILVMLLLTVTMGVGVIEIYRITSISKANSILIRDCTDPAGKCFKDGQARTATAVGNINRVVVAAAYCARIPANDTQVEVENCVKRILLK